MTRNFRFLDPLMILYHPTPISETIGTKLSPDLKNNYVLLTVIYITNVHVLMTHFLIAVSMENFWCGVS